MYQALYRSFRPETFDELLGQEHIEKILKNQISTGSTGHAYVFCGTRGTGKTTTARLLAKALNCTSEGDKPCGECENCKAIAAGNFIDVSEIDAASFRGIENIRDLREEVNYPPVMGRNKVYIIDEAHMLTTEAFNALLKTLEEPPANTVFILATTEPNKLPATILSRCMRLDFKRVSEETILGLFKRICKQTGVKADDDALALIASNADGSVRDGLSILDRCIAGNSTLSRDDVLFLLGMAGAETYIGITDAVLSSDTASALSLFAQALSEGKEVSRFALDWIEHFRNLMIIKFTDKPENVLNLSLENIEKLRAQAERVSIEDIKRCIMTLSKSLSDARYSPKPRVLVELAIITLCGKIDCSAAGDSLAASGAGIAAGSRGNAQTKADYQKSAPLSSAGQYDPPVSSDEKYSHSNNSSGFTFLNAEESSANNSTFVQPEESDQILDNIWFNVMQDEKIPALLRMSHSILRDMKNGKFTVQVSNEITEGQLKANKALLEELMEFETGKKLILDTIVK